MRRRDVERLEVAVDGGTLAVHRWPADHPGAPVVLAAHGITGNGLTWARVADHLDGAVTLVAPDLRGRAASAGVGPPYGMAAHAADVIAVLDALGVGSTVLVGHSMGGFVVAGTAVRYPDRVRSLVLVDGGVGFAVPPGLDIDAILEATIGPAMQRLRMTFPTRAAYTEFWQAHPALAAEWAPWIDEAMQHDLTGAEPQLRSSCRIDAIRVDGADILVEESVREAVHALPVPAVLLWAPRGMRDEPQGMYDEARLEHAGLDPARVRTVVVQDTNHYLIIYADRGAAAVASHIRSALVP
jgi:pimeloyl-ACP methyl ester carboxylesterase